MNGTRIAGLRLPATAVIAGLLFLTGCRAHPPVTTESEVTALAEPLGFCAPARGQSAMASTYDRQGGNADWWETPPPVDGRELYEALRLDGPGCLKRIWYTNIPVTEWLFFFDGETEARLRLSTRELFADDRPDLQPVQGDTSGASYSYLPLPYARSLRVLLRMPNVSPNPRNYWQFNYESYPAGTRVTSWSAATAATATLLRVNAVGRAVAATNRAILGRLTWQPQRLPARQAAEVVRLSGPGTLTAFAVRPVFTNQNAILRSLLLRGLVLEAYWDGNDRPSVQAPLGDFFCNGLHPREFASLPMAHLDGAYLCRLPMPFRRQARLVIRNDTPVDVVLDIAAECDSGDPGDRLYLHAAFRAAMSAGVPFHVMETTGRGKYVGCYLTALGMDGSWNILEGDEYFHRDGGREPVHHGTGLEDYFNAGWYYYGLFELPLHGLLEKAAMRTAQYRFHLTDPVTFSRRLDMEWEFGDGNRAGGYMSSCAYWYQDRPGPAGSSVPPLEQRFPPLDQVGRLALMDGFFELERAGVIADAEERAAFYASTLDGQPEQWFHRLRSLAYREMRLGYGAVKAEYAALAAATNAPPEAVRQARLLLWRGQGPGRAIFGAHAFADYRLFVDGQLVGEGNNPVAWQAWPVELSPAEHLLQAEITPRQSHGAFFSAGFTSYFTNVVSDASWDFSREKPAGWPAADGDRAPWQPIEGTLGIFPSMTWWRFDPNAFPCVQSGYQQGGPCAGWDNPPGRTFYLRRRIVVPAVAADRPPMPPRVTLLSGPAVRPKDDTSNEGVAHRHP